MENTKYTVSNYLLDRLHELGLTHLFGVPGDYASTFLKTLGSYAGIEYVPNLNELGVGYSADGYARFKGVAAATVQYGVGTFSILNAIAGSYVERVPVALVAPSPSTNDRTLARTEGILYHHSTGDFNSNELVMEHVTVASVSIASAEEAPYLIDLALTAMLNHSRPVYIEVFQDIFGAECAPPTGILRPEMTKSYAPSLNEAVEVAWQKWQDAKFPVIWSGVEVQRFGLQEKLQRLIDVSGAYFTTTSLGKTVLNEDQPAFLGTYAGPASPDFTRAAMQHTDCPMALGVMVTDDYLDIMHADNNMVIEVSDTVTRVGFAHFPEVELGDFIEAMIEKCSSASDFPRSYSLPTYEPDPPPPASTDKNYLTYLNFYETLSHWLIEEKHIDDCCLILGESTSLYVFGNLMGMPQNSFVAQAAWGSLGHETGCALGVGIASGKTPIVVAGDGGFMMMCQAVSSLVRHQSGAVVFVMTNGGYAIEQAFVNIDAFTEEGSYAGFDLLPTWDLVALAKGFGANGARLETLKDLNDFLSNLSTDNNCPTLVDVKIPLKDLPPQLRRLATTP